MSAEKIEEIKKVSKSDKAEIEPTNEITSTQEEVRAAPNKDRFDELMTRRTEKVHSIENVDPQSKVSLMDEISNLNHRVDRFSKVSPPQLVAQADEVINQIDAVKKKLSSDLHIQPSVQNLLQNKLSHIDENLKVALSKAGVEYTPAPAAAESKLVNPIERFLGFLTHGQEQLKTLSTEVELMHLNNKEITPANMLRIQMKVGYIQQEIEFLTATLNKALESTKTIMNVQV